jgi:hypothetical protein
MDPSCMKEESDKTGVIPFSCYSHLRYNHGYSPAVLFVLIIRAVVHIDKTFQTVLPSLVQGSGQALFPEAPAVRSPSVSFGHRCRQAL